MLGLKSIFTVGLPSISFIIFSFSSKNISSLSETQNEYLLMPNSRQSGGKSTASRKERDRRKSKVHYHSCESNATAWEIRVNTLSLPVRLNEYCFFLFKLQLILCPYLESSCMQSKVLAQFFFIAAVSIG